MKTPDNYFRGVPALWNVVALYLFVARPGPAAGAIAVTVLAVLSFAPVRFVHPFRVADYQPWLRMMAVLWAVSTLALLWPGWNPDMAGLWLWASCASAAVLLGLGVIRTLRGDRRPAGDGPAG
jgi:phosphatidylcholine synthase